MKVYYKASHKHLHFRSFWFSFFTRKPVEVVNRELRSNLGFLVNQSLPNVPKEGDTGRCSGLTACAVDSASSGLVLNHCRVKFLFSSTSKWRPFTFALCYTTGCCLELINF